jgi:hypothetical protein
MIPAEPAGPDAKSSGGLLAIAHFAGVMTCIALVAFAQIQLFRGTAALPDGGMARALRQLIFHRQSPPSPAVWYQVPAPISAARINDLPADVAGRVKPLIGWLTESRGLQQGEYARILAEQDRLTIDISGIDEIGCRRIMQATRSEAGWIDAIAVTGTTTDMISLPTSISLEGQCKKATGYIRMVRNSPASRQK